MRLFLFTAISLFSYTSYSQTNCQVILPSATSSIASINDTIDICLGDQVTFNNTTTYPQNNQTYNQDNSTSLFEWDLFNSSANTENTTKVFNAPGFYPILLTITDVNGCDTTAALYYVRVSGPPSFSGSFTNPNQLCLGDNIELFGQSTPNIYGFSYGIFGQELFLDDIVGAQFESIIPVNQFESSQNITTVTDLSEVCVIMEHSYIGDLEITLTCPNGSSIQLHNQTGGSTHLGEPIDNDLDLGPGIGYNYCWIESSSNGTWGDYATTFSPQTLPAGNYEPTESFSNLIGCPLNGDWTVNVVDNLPSDNGFIFDLNINFDPSLFPQSNQNIEFSPAISSEQWLVNNTSIINTNQYIGPTNISGLTNYTYEITDEFNCTYDTTFMVEVGSPTQFDVEVDYNTNDFAPVEVVFTNNSQPTSADYQWFIDTTIFSSNYAPSDYLFEEGGEYTLLVTGNNGGCIDTFKVNIPILFIDKAPNVFSPNSDGINDEFFIPAVGIGSYTVKVFNRWGKELYTCTSEGESQSCAWNGNNKNGNKVKDGVYYYTISITNKAGDVLDISKNTGSFNLLRD